jgi:hypothetical protein
VAELDPKLSRALIAILRTAAPPAGHGGTTIEWREQRDGWVDRLDPSFGAPAFSYDDARALVVFLGDSAASRESRMSAAEWSATIDSIVTRLLSALR